MLGNMMQQPLLISSILEHAKNQYPAQEVVSRSVEGGIHRYSITALHQRSKQLANALLKLGVQPGDRVASLAWNTYRHMELYYATSGINAIIHTVNPRLFNEQIDFIINHAEDSVLFIDLSFVKNLEALLDNIPTVKTFIILTDREHMPKTTLPNALCYEEFIAPESMEHEWISFDENSAACLCYTSGTTGNPKGVLYSHRSTVLHALASCLPDALNLSVDGHHQAT